MVSLSFLNFFLYKLPPELNWDFSPTLNHPSAINNKVTVLCWLARLFRGKIFCPCLVLFLFWSRPPGGSSERSWIHHCSPGQSWWGMPDSSLAKKDWFWSFPWDPVETLFWEVQLSGLSQSLKVYSHCLCDFLWLCPLGPFSYSWLLICLLWGIHPSLWTCLLRQFFDTLRTFTRLPQLRGEPIVRKFYTSTQSDP